MWHRVLGLGRLVLIAILLQFADSVQRPTPQCDFYNKTSCPPSNPNCQRSETCVISQSQRTQCFVFWNVTGGEERVVMKGCWSATECNNQTQCQPRLAPNPNSAGGGQLYFCCCEGDFCNRNITPKSFPPPISTTTVSTSTPLAPRKDLTFQTVQYTIFPMLGLFLLIPICYLYRTRKAARANHMPLPTSEPVTNGTGGAPTKTLSGTVVLDRRRARGRFGEVHSAFYHRSDGTVQVVAVKIFHVQERKSWALEQSFYNCGRISHHENILRFLGAEEHRPAEGGQPGPHQLWLITDFHERGSLYDHLKGSLVTWAELVSISQGMARGLEFLHDAELNGPAVAHRDFKSKNVLLKDDMTACIADFGLSLRFDQTPGQVHGQVGTRRYMAPEVLDGAINFNCHDFLCIDMYAMGLVLWEVASRCSTADGPIGEYQLPFEEEVGLHPSLEDMQELVVRRKMRPILKEHWKSHPLFAALCNTIDECWDQDAEARLSASTVVERIERFPRTDPKAAPTPTLNNTNHVNQCPPPPPPPPTNPPAGGLGGGDGQGQGQLDQGQPQGQGQGQTQGQTQVPPANYTQSGVPLTALHAALSMPDTDDILIVSNGGIGNGVGNGSIGLKPLGGSGGGGLVGGGRCGRSDCWSPPLTASQA